MSSLLKNLFEFKHADSVGVKLYLRIFELFIAAYTIFYAWNWGYYILKISDVVLPLGLANYINVEIFFGNYLPLLCAAVMTIMAILAYFTKLRWLYMIVFLLLHILYVTRFSLGEIPHSSNLVGFGILGLGLAGCFIKNKWEALSFAYGFLIFFVGLGYTTAGISKLIATGITWPDGYHLWLWIAEKSTDVLSAEGSFTLSWIQEWTLQSRFMGTLFLSFGLLTELSAFLIWWKKLRPIVTLLLIGMHIGIYYAMNIWFMSYMYGLVIIGFPWYELFNLLAKKNDWHDKEVLKKYL